MTRDRTQVGVVKEIFRYPVKSMRGESLSETKLGWHGLAGDRRYAFVQSDEAVGGFPWLTPREAPQLVRYVASLDMPSNPAGSPVNVTTPAGRVLRVESPELLYELAAESGRRLHLMKLYSGVFDAMDVSIISTSTVADIGKGAGVELDVRRFRPNLVVEPCDSRPYPEDRWLGELLVFGDRGDSARLHANRKTVRCQVVNVSPDTAEADERVMKQIVTTRKNQAGIYGTTIFPGTVKAGDPIWLYHR
jgi:uncharacterized protein